MMIMSVRLTLCLVMEIKFMKKFFQKYIYFLLSVGTLLFFLFGQGVTWYAMGGDTESYYIHFGHHIEAKPLYPLFFHVLDLIFGSGFYLYAASVIQVIIAVFCLISFVHFIGTKLKLDLFSTVVVWIASLFPFYLLLPEDPIPHVLMTESLTYPLLYLYIVMILKGIYDKKEKYFYYSGLFVILMTLIRGQMLFLMAVSGAAYFYFLIKEKYGKWKRIMAGLVVYVAFLLICTETESLITTVYEQLFFHAPKQDYSAQTLVQKALFCSDEKNAELFTDELEREIFEKTYKGMAEMETTYKFRTGDLWDWKHTTASFGADSYLVQDVIEEVLTEHDMWPADSIERENQLLYYSRQLTGKLMKENFSRCLLISFSMMPAGFVSTVLMHKESVYGLIHIATLILYVMAIIVSIGIYAYTKKKKTVQGFKESEYMWLVLCTAIVNVISANLVHFGLQRYLAYTVGLFYVGGYLMLRKMWLMWRVYKKEVRP